MRVITQMPPLPAAIVPPATAATWVVPITWFDDWPMRSTRPRSYTHTNPPKTVIWVGARTLERGSGIVAVLRSALRWIANRSIDCSTLSVTQTEPAATVSALGEGPTGASAVRCPEPGSRRTTRPPPGAAMVAQIEPAVSRRAVAGPLRRALTVALPEVGSIRHSRTPAASQTPSAPTASR